MVDKPEDYVQIFCRHLEDRIDQNIAQTLLAFKHVNIDDYAKGADDLYDRFIRTPQHQINQASLSRASNQFQRSRQIQNQTLALRNLQLWTTQ